MQRTGQVFLIVGIWLGLGLNAYLYFQSREAPSAKSLEGGRIELVRARDGHFHIDGSINSQPTRFLIDTGASTISVSTAAARLWGLECQRQSTFRTANGAVQGCMTRVDTVTFGPFRMHNLSVAILPNLGGEALLGMNALKAVQLEQNGDRLRLSP